MRNNPHALTLNFSALCLDCSLPHLPGLGLGLVVRPNPYPNPRVTTAHAK